jgi:hypothetical protein
VTSRVLGTLGVALLLLAGCGGGDAEDVLGETADNLGAIRAGTLDMALVVEPIGGKPFGFEIEGPFELRGGRALPVMEVDYTRIVEGRRATVTLVSDGEDVHAEANGERVELSPEQIEELRGAAGALGGGVRLPLDEWFEDAEVDDGGSVGGAETDRVAGDLDVVAVANGLSGLAGIRRLRGRDAERLREATKEATFELWTGKEDRLLRRLEMVADFGFGVPPDLRRALGDAVGAKVTFRLAVSNPRR